MTDLRTGDKVELEPSTSQWLRGDRHGFVAHVAPDGKGVHVHTEGGQCVDLFVEQVTKIPAWRTR